jgi:hypothetical protein
MAASDVALSIILTATDQTSAGLSSATASLGKLEKATGLAKAAFGALAGAATVALVGGLSQAANAAAEDEANMAKLRQAIENTGIAYEDVNDAVQAQIKHGQELAFTDTQIRDSLTALTVTTGSVSEAMNLQSLALDIARTKGMDLTKASELVGRVHEGNTGILKRYGIVLGEGATATQALAALQQKFGGQAEVYGNSTSGAIFKVKDAIAEWAEGIGHAMGPAQGFIALLPGIQAGSILAGSALGGLTGALGITRVGMMLTIPVAGGLQIALLPLILVIGAIALAVGLLALAWSNNWGDIQGKAAAALEFLGNAFGAFGSFLAGLWDRLAGGIHAAIDAILGPIYNLINVVQNAISWLQQLGAAQAANAASAVQGDINNQYTGPQQPGFATGTSYVPYTGLFRLHQGEAVIPASMNQTGSGGWGNGSDHDHPIIINLDGETIATVVGRRFTQARRSQGLA